MIKSMTGYGRSQKTAGKYDVTVEIRAVNHRFFEFSARVPRAYGQLESKIKAYLQGKVARGKIEVGVTLISTDDEARSVQINESLAQSYVKALRSLSVKLDLRDDLTLNSISRLPDVYSIRSEQESDDEAWALVCPVMDEAIAKFLDMRTAEGDKLKQDMLEKIESIERRVTLVEEQSPISLLAYRERLTAQVKELLENRQVDESRILQEVAIFADRIAVDEETVRLHSHIAQFREIIEHEEPVGRKLDFLLQEFQREANTIGSKMQSTQTAKIIIEMKNDIEKIREQVQNIE